jgi:hypothetical protein
LLLSSSPGSCVFRVVGLSDGELNPLRMGNTRMYEQTELAPQVRRWDADGKWIDLGEWIRARNGVYEYHPTPEEIAAKCELIRTIDNWQGAYARALRGGKYAVMETKGL